ncbi:MAG TPA: hypothetical protein GXX59_03185 [Syntrophomonadaceae bacterium]|nr:hypothetical protein [Syntrophomonadaceae bacterium]
MSIFQDAVDYAETLRKDRAKPKIKGVTRRVTADQVLRKLDALGLNVNSERTLQRYVKDKLIPMPDRKSLGRGKGRITDYAKETPAEFYASYKLRHEYRIRSSDVISRCREKALIMENSPDCPGRSLAEWDFSDDPQVFFEVKCGELWLMEKHKALHGSKDVDCEVCKYLRGDMFY